MPRLPLLGGRAGFKGASSFLLAVRLPLVELARHLGNSREGQAGNGNSLCVNTKGSAETPHGRFWEHVRRERVQGRGQHKQVVF